MDFTYKLITVAYYQDGLRGCLTQQYTLKYNMGHYCFTITNADGHILRAFSSSGEAPRRKATVEWCQELFLYALKYNREDWIKRGWMS